MCAFFVLLQVSASLDQLPYKFQGYELMVSHRVEVIPHGDLVEIVKKSLIAYYRNTKMKPQQIIFYRDGVSEGQFLEVRPALPLSRSQVVL